MANSSSYFQQVDGAGAGGIMSSVTDDIRTHFRTREGVYRLMKLSEYSRPTRTPPNGPNATPFRIAFVSAPDTYNRRVDDLLAFIVGRELYIYYYNGTRKAADLTRPIEKKMYRGPSPTCHDFNQFTAKSDRIMLIVGFTLGQIQLIEPMLKEYSKLFNEERMVDNTKVTCIQWVPGSPNHFVAAHASGQLYVYDERLPCGATPPTYQLFKHGNGFSIHTCRAKSTRNPLYRWLIDGCGAIHGLAFSPCTHYLAVVSADGQLRVFNYDQMDIVGSMKSYFGGLRCVAWSPDGQFVATGGEDDLVTIWSFAERRVVCRGSGHHSWVSSVAFDLYTCTIPDSDVCSVSDIKVSADGSEKSDTRTPTPSEATKEVTLTTYRLGSVGDDAQLCLWEITEDMLSPRTCARPRTSVVIGATTLPESVANGPECATTHNSTVVPSATAANAPRPPLLTSSSESSGLSQKFASLSIAEQYRLKESGAGGAGKRPFGTLAGRTSDTRLLFTRSTKSGGTNGTAAAGDGGFPAPALGSSGCPCLGEIPLLEPLVCKKVATERLTAIAFREDCFVVACQEGVVSTWARPSTLTKNGYM